MWEGCIIEHLFAKLNCLISNDVPIFLVEQRVKTVRTQSFHWLKGLNNKDNLRISKGKSQARKVFIVVDFWCGPLGLASHGEERCPVVKRFCKTCMV